MAVKHRRQRRRVKRVATLGAATATVTALTVGVAPPPAQAAAVQRDLRLQSGVQIFPPPDQIPDLTGGLGTQVYNQFQTVGAQLETAFVDNFNLLALLQAAGIDPTTPTKDALNGILGGALGALPVDVEDLLGVDLTHPLSSAGVNVITTGGLFTLIRLLGVDLGWVPSFPNSVADEINNTPYLDVSLDSIFTALGLPTSGLKFDSLKAALALLGITLPPLSTNAADVRIPIVAGWGFGAFAAGAAYQQVVDDLPNQPGGANYTGTNPLLGSFTILPMILIDNPGRANGGILARAYPLFGLLGIDTVTPDTQVQSSGTSIVSGIPVVGDIPLFGLTPGGANLIPIKIDATAEYLPLSDFAAWPNPFTMANNVAAGLFPTYILRNQSLDTLGTVLIDQAVSQLGADVTDYLANPGDNPQLGPKLNIYITIPANSLPLLEPTYLAYDVINLLTGANLNNPIGTALSPVLTSLVNLGYTDVSYNPTTGIYERSLDEADVPTAFGTLPADVDWEQVPGHLINNLVTGIEKAISDGLVSQTPVSNPIKTLLGLLGVGGSSNLSGLDLSALTDSLNSLTPEALGNAENNVGTQSLTKTTSFEPQPITQTKVGADTVKLKSVEGDSVKKLTAAADGARREVEKSVTEAGERTKASAERARERTAKAVKDAQERVNKLAEDGRKQIQSAAEGVQKGAEKAVNEVKGAKKPEKKQEKKPEKKDTKKDAA
ncbi:AAA family ATPase [Mycobacterium sp. NPDC051198]